MKSFFNYKYSKYIVIVMKINHKFLLHYIYIYKLYFCYSFIRFMTTDHSVISLYIYISKHKKHQKIIKYYIAE